MNLLESVRYFTPELVLSIEALVILIVVICKGKRMAAPLALMGLVVAFVVLMSIRHNDVVNTLFSGAIALGKFTIFFKAFCIAVTFFTILFSLKSSYKIAPEYYVILLFATVGMCLLVSANDLLMAYVAIETVSISSYILTSFVKGNSKSSEAGLKYVIYGAIASGIMIYGMSLLYGVAGSTNFMAIRQYLSGASTSPLLITITLLILVGFGYKIAAVPFHMWCPDVYEGAPTPITAFLSVGPKAAGFAILIRFLSILFEPSGPTMFNVAFVWQPMLIVISILTMVVGNLGALKQTNLKRLLAYSSIAHCGYMLMGVVLSTREGWEAVILYFVVYFFMNLGAFLVVIAVEEKTGSADIKEYRGLGWRMPLVGIIMAIFLFSLTGLPPLAGFIGKLYIFKAVIEKALLETGWYYLGINVWYWLAVIGAMNSVIALYYYARVIRAMFLETPSEAAGLPSRVSLYYSILLVIFVIPVLALGVYWVPLWNIVKASIGDLIQI
ncbi:MAG: NADH-quinone oxidoreductase subunit N [Planctomycetes bacterium]|nr:NADH-quinone oxidoreductase subunit N [Planctomycetota bacterium]